MATTFELKIVCSQEDSARAIRVLEECHALISRLESELTEFSLESPVARLNQALPGQRISFSQAGWELVELSEYLEELSGNSFSAMAKSTGRSPKRMRERLGRDALSRSVWRLDTEAHLSFGAIGKGYALDCCRSVILQAGFEEFCLNGGGSSIVMSGLAPLGRPWSWGWSWAKDQQGQPLGLEFRQANGRPISIGVSGLHEKGNHLLDPRTSERTADALLSALVAHPSAAWADALSTALFVSGWDEGLTLLSASVQAPALAIIDGSGTPRWNGVFQGLFGPIGEN